jgi:hypothetical protein
VTFLRINTWPYILEDSILHKSCCEKLHTANLYIYLNYTFGNSHKLISVLLLVSTIFNSFRKQFPEIELETYNIFLIMWTWPEATALYSSNNCYSSKPIRHSSIFENRVLRRIFG